MRRRNVTSITFFCGAPNREYATPDEKTNLIPPSKRIFFEAPFILLLLVAVCVIPFALGQRTTTKQSAVAVPLLLGSAPVSPLSGSDAPFTFDNTGSLNTARYDHTATLLPNGKVLVAGGLIIAAILTSAELYDPASGTWSATGSLNTARDGHTATLLPNGKVLVAGGDDNSGILTQRGTVRPGQRDLDCHGQPQHRTLLSHGDVAAQRQGAGGRGI